MVTTRVQKNEKRLENDEKPQDGEGGRY